MSKPKAVMQWATGDIKNKKDLRDSWIHSSVNKDDDSSFKDLMGIGATDAIHAQPEAHPQAQAHSQANVKFVGDNLEQEKTVDGWIIKPVPLSYQPYHYSQESENELQDENASQKEKEDVYPCVFYSNHNFNAAIRMMKLDLNILTIYFTRENLTAENAEEELKPNQPKEKDDLNGIQDFLDKIVICHGVKVQVFTGIKDLLNNHYSSTTAVLYPAYQNGETLKIFYEVLQKDFAVPAEVVQHLQQSMKCRKKTAEEEKFLLELQSLQTVDPNALSKALKQASNLAQAKAIDDYCKKHFSYQPFKSVNGSEQNYYAGYAFYLLAMQYYNNDASLVYKILNFIDDKDNLYYPLAQFHMGRLILDGRMAERPGNDPKNPEYPKYHARAMRHLLRSTEKGFHQGLKELTVQDVTHEELRHYISRAMTLVSAELDSNHRLIRVRQRVETLGDKAHIIAKLNIKNGNNQPTVNSNDSLHMKTESDVVSSPTMPANSLILSTGKMASFLPMQNAASSSVARQPWVTVDATAVANAQNVLEINGTSSSRQEDSNKSSVMKSSVMSSKPVSLTVLAVAQTPPCSTSASKNTCK